MRYVNAVLLVTGLVAAMVALLALAGNASAQYTSYYEGDWLAPGGTTYTTSYYSWSTPYYHTWGYTPVSYWHYTPVSSWYYYGGYNSFDPWWTSNVYSGGYHTYFWFGGI